MRETNGPKMFAFTVCEIGVIFDVFTVILIVGCGEKYPKPNPRTGT